jgi:hypothetical protein
LARMTGIFPQAVICEAAAGGFGVIDLLSHQLPILPVYPRGSKEERAGAVCYLVNTGRVALPESAPWLRDFVEELQNFPLSATADQVDAFVHGLAFASRPAEFKLTPVDFVVTYDCLAADDPASAFDEMNRFDAQLAEAEAFIRGKDNQ